MSNRRIQLIAAITVAAALGASGVALAGRTISDPRADMPGLKRKPELDIRRASAADQPRGRVKHKVRMQGRIKPGKKFTRPFVLINTRGNNKSKYEYLILGPRVFERKGREFEKVGASKVRTKRRAWVYSFRPERIGLEAGDSYGWAVLTSKGKTFDLAPNNRYVKHRIRDVAAS